jgi:hypothetical protein
MAKHFMTLATLVILVKTLDLIEAQRVCEPFAGFGLIVFGFSLV